MINLSIYKRLKRKGKVQITKFGNAAVLLIQRHDDTGDPLPPEAVALDPTTLLNTEAEIKQQLANIKELITDVETAGIPVRPITPAATPIEEPNETTNPDPH